MIVLLLIPVFHFDFYDLRNNHVKKIDHFYARHRFFDLNEFLTGMFSYYQIYLIAFDKVL